MAIQVSLSQAQLDARNAIRQLRPPEPKIIIPPNVTKDLATPRPFPGSFLNPINYPGLPVLPNPTQINGPLQAYQAAARGPRLKFLAQYADGVAEHDLAYEAEALFAANQIEMASHGDRLFDGFEVPYWDFRYVNPHDVKDDPSKAVAIQKKLIDNGVERIWTGSQHLAGEWLLTPADLICARQNEYAMIMASPFLKSHIPAGKDMAKKELNLADIERLQQAAGEEMYATIDSAAALDAKVLNIFTGSTLWHSLYDFPPRVGTKDRFLQAAEKLMPFVEYAAKKGVVLALEVHPSEQAYSLPTTVRFIRALLAVNPEATRRAFRINMDESHQMLGGADPVYMVENLGADSIYFNEYNNEFPINTSLTGNDFPVTWIANHHHKGGQRVNDRPGASVYGDHEPLGSAMRTTQFVSGHLDNRKLVGGVDNHRLYHAFAHVGYAGSLAEVDGSQRAHTAEWEDKGKDEKSAGTLTARTIREMQGEHNTGTKQFDAGFKGDDKPKA